MKTRRRTGSARARRGAGGKPGKVIALTDECTIAQAGALKSRLARVLAHPGPVCLDAGATRRIDTACFQLLLAFVRDRRAAGKAVTWGATGPDFVSTARTLGLSAALGMA